MKNSSVETQRPDDGEASGALTVAAHAQSQALLQPAVLAAVAVGPVDEAVPLP